MEKKKIKIISSIFGVVALCGLSTLFLLNKSEGKTLVVNAYDSVNIGGGGGELNEISTTFDGLSNVFTASSENSTYNFTYSKVYDGESEFYSVNIKFNYLLATFDSLSLSGSSDNYAEYNITCDNEINNIVIEVEHYWLSCEPGYAPYIPPHTSCTIYFNVYGNYVENGVVQYQYVGSYVQNRRAILLQVFDNLSSITSTTSVHSYEHDVSADIEVISSYDSYVLGYETGYSEGYTSGVSAGFDTAYNSGYYNGYDVGYYEGVASQEQAIIDAYNHGRTDGFNEGYNSDSTVTSIFSGILQVGLLPINFFLSIFNFNILGINIASFVSALLTIAITIVVIRIIMGSKNG